MMPSEKQLNEPGPVRDLWAHAAVRERFSAGELFSNWVAANAGADKETVRTARLAAVELQRASKSALGINGRPASTLDAGDRIGVLRVIGSSSALAFLEQTPPAERTRTESLFADILNGEGVSINAQDRGQLAALNEVAPLAAAAGAPVQIDVGAVRQKLEQLDFLTLLGGPDLHRFIGRAEELAAMRAVWRAGAHSVVSITAPGGMGKSALVSRFVADVLEAPEERPTAVFHFDFDRRDLQSARPATLLAEMLRQAPRWTAPELQPLARRFAASADTRWREDAYGQSRGLEGFGFLGDYRIEQLIEVLAPHGGGRMIIIADSVEQVFNFDDEAAFSPWRVSQLLAEAHSTVTQVLTIYSGRYIPSRWMRDIGSAQIALASFNEDEAMAYLRAEAARADSGVDDATLTEVIASVGRSPLALRLASRLLKSDDARRDPIRWIEAVRGDPERIQATLHDRILKRLRPELRKLAYPGLLLRRLTHDIVAHVLAKPCKLDLSSTTPERLIAECASEGQLFVRDPSDPDMSAVYHRQDVRALMLPDLDETIDADLARTVNLAAVEYYRLHDDGISRAEELYHRLRLDEPPSELTPRWTEAAGQRLKHALDELPSRARGFVRSRLGAASLAEVESHVGPSRSNSVMEQQTLAELSRAVRRELQRGAVPLETLARFNVDKIDGPLGDVYAEALVASGQIGRLLVESRNLLYAPPNAPSAVRTAIFATTAALLEGQGKLDEALAYWEQARAPQPHGDEEATLTELGGAVGWLRTRRKLRLMEGRREEMKRLYSLAMGQMNALASRPVLLREVVAELGDLFTAPDDFFGRMLSILFRTGEAFPSVVADRERLKYLSNRLGVGPATSPQHLGDLATKFAFSGDGEFHRRLVAVLRDEVDWTLARALSRTPAPPPQLSL